MKLQHITVEKCPECGAPAKRWFHGDQHVSGEWNEYVEFDCFGRVSYCPNFPGETTFGGCNKLRQRLAREAHAASAARRATVDWAKCDAQFVAHVMDTFDRYKVDYRVVKKTQTT